MLDTNNVHIPAKPDQFEFDSEVSAIFPDMARRSIPNYEAFHKLHAHFVARTLKTGGRIRRILDVGASHGAFFTALKDCYAEEGSTLPFNVELVAVDSSEDMCRHLRAKHPDANVYMEDANLPSFRHGEAALYDVINCTYVIQFVRPERQIAMLNRLTRLLRPGGLLILGQKAAAPGVLGRVMQDKYIDWRIANGYTREEIEAKTRALKGSMWPMSHDVLMAYLRDNYTEVAETTRMFMFSTLIALK